MTNITPYIGINGTDYPNVCLIKTVLRGSSRRTVNNC